MNSFVVVVDSLFVVVNSLFVIAPIVGVQGWMWFCDTVLYALSSLHCL